MSVLAKLARSNLVLLRCVLHAHLHSLNEQTVTPALMKRGMTQATSSQMASIYSALAKVVLGSRLESTRCGCEHEDASGGTHSVRTPPWFAVMMRRTVRLWA